jgi:hypothetical protein
MFIAACQAVPPAVTVPATAVEASTATPAAVSEGSVTLEIPEVSITVSADGIEMPAELGAGPVRFHVTVSEEGAGSPMLARFVDGKGVADLEQALAAMETEGPAAIFSAVALYGGGEGAYLEDFTLDLEGGDHVAMVFGEDAPLLQTFSVLLNEIEPEPPVASVEAKMRDFAFELPASIPAGEHVWRFINEGGQWHETVVFVAQEGMSVEDLIAAASGEVEGDAAPEMAFVWTPASEGEQGWANINLPAGDYVVICFLPDVNGDMSPHFAHGMVRNLHVE